MKRVVEVLLWITAVVSVVWVVQTTRERIRKAENAAIIAELKAEQATISNPTMSQQIEAVHQERKRIAEQIREGENSIRQIADPADRRKKQIAWRQKRAALEKTSAELRDKMLNALKDVAIDVEDLKSKTQDFNSRVPRKSAE